MGSRGGKSYSGKARSAAGGVNREKEQKAREDEEYRQRSEDFHKAYFASEARKEAESKEKVKSLGSMKFKNESEKTIWIINNLHPKDSIDLLGVTKRLYKHRDEAKAWHKKMTKLVHPDNNRGVPGAQNALIFVQRLYEDMIN
ncbi:MAG: hypothetical protein IJ899_20740 [Blautia sp.]|nr:hypothetical protein [Blautia sp.]